MATSTINVRVDEDLKRSAEAIYSELGLNLSTAINIFLRASVRYDGIPFDMRLDVPNDETRRALDDVSRGKDLSPIYTDTKKLMEALNA